MEKWLPFCRNSSHGKFAIMNCNVWVFNGNGKFVLAIMNKWKNGSQFAETQCLSAERFLLLNVETEPRFSVYIPESAVCSFTLPDYLSYLLVFLVFFAFA